MTVEGKSALSRSQSELARFLTVRKKDLQRETGISPDWIVTAIRSAYETFDAIDQQLLEHDTEPLSQIVELANLSPMLGNLLGAGIARASDGAYTRNRPHAYPDLLPKIEGVQPAEIKIALETNTPKGHLPKAGLYVTFRYVLGDPDGSYARGKENRGPTIWIWECRVGHLTTDDYNLSNTEGDSGKTAVIKLEAFAKMSRIFYVPSLLPYASRTSRWGDAS